MRVRFCSRFRSTRSWARFAAEARSEGAGGFVGEEEFGLVDKGADDGDALAFAAGELAGAVFEAGAEADAIEEFAGAVRALARRVRSLDASVWHKDVFEDGALGQKVVPLKDEADLAVAEVSEGKVIEGGEVLAVEADGAAGGAVEGADDVEECAFAGTGRADDGEGIAGSEVEVYAVENREGGAGCAGIGFGDVLEVSRLMGEMSNDQALRTKECPMTQSFRACAMIGIQRW
jgi:hypothetical protein